MSHLHPVRVPPPHPPGNSRPSIMTKCSRLCIPCRPRFHPDRVYALHSDRVPESSYYVLECSYISAAVRSSEISKKQKFLNCLFSLYYVKSSKLDGLGCTASETNNVQCHHPRLFTSYSFGRFCSGLDCSLPLWRVHEIKRMYLDPRTHGLFIT